MDRINPYYVRINRNTMYIFDGCGKKFVEIVKSINIDTLRRIDDSSSNLWTHEFEFQICALHLCVKTLWKMWFDRQVNYKKDSCLLDNRITILRSSFWTRESSTLAQPSWNLADRRPLFSHLFLPFTLFATAAYLSLFLFSFLRLSVTVCLALCQTKWTMYESNIFFLPTQFRSMFKNVKYDWDLFIALLLSNLFSFLSKLINLDKLDYLFDRILLKLEKNL